MIKTDFAYTDEFGQESRTTKTFTDTVLEDNTTLDFLLAEFKCFLLGAGFLQEQVEKIGYME